LALKRNLRIAVLFPSTGLIDGEICDMAEERGADALIYKVAPQSIAAEHDAEAVAAMVTDMGSPSTLAAVARTAAAVSPDVVVWACTSGSFLGGGQRGHEQASAMSKALGGIPATTTSIAIAAALERRGARRVAVVTPYHPDIGERFVQYLRDRGYEPAPATHAGCGSDEAVGALTLEVLLPLARAAVTPDSDALVIPCTAVRRQDLEAELGKTFGIPVILANSATLDHCLDLARKSA
jgi:maleate cis-trans isomerase